MCNMETSENFCLHWNDFESNLVSAVRELRAESDFFDVTLGCNDREGRSLRGHRVILSACSNFFKKMLRQQTNHYPGHPHPYIYLRGVSFQDISNVLDFMYNGEVKVAQEDLDSFLSLAEELQIKGLTNQDKDGLKKNVQNLEEPPAKRVRQSMPNSQQQSLAYVEGNSTTDKNCLLAKDIKTEPESLQFSEDQASTSHQSNCSNNPEEDLVRVHNNSDVKDVPKDEHLPQNKTDSIVDIRANDLVDFDQASNADYDEEAAIDYVEVKVGDQEATDDGKADDKAHQILQIGTTNYVCQICGKQFGQKSTARRHFKLMHLPQSQAECEICHNILKNQYYLDLHTRQVHDNNGAQCPICHKMFKNVKCRNQHRAKAHGNIFK